MRLPHLSKTQKKVAIGAAGGIGLLAVTYLALRPKKTSALPPPPSSPTNLVTKDQRVIAWSKTSVLTYGPGKGQVYIKFKAADGHIRAGFVDESIVQRDPPPETPMPPMSLIQVAQSRALAGLGALSGLGAGAHLPQQQVPAAPPAVPNATMTDDSLMFATSGGKARLAELQKQLVHIIEVVTTGAGVFVSDEQTFRKIYTHGGGKVLEGWQLNGLMDTLKNHAHCQTAAASMVGLYNDWVWPFYNQNVYRYSADVTPDANLDRYPNSPIDPVKDNAAFEAALNAAIEASIQTALKKASLDSILNEIGGLLGNSFFTLLFGKLAGLGLMIEVTPETRNNLAQFARDMAAQNRSRCDSKDQACIRKATLPTTMKVESIHAPKHLSGLGALTDEPIPEPMLTIIHSSAGAYLVTGIIDMFESHDPKVNPCITEMNFDLVLSMFVTVVSLFLTVVSLGSAGFFGPAIAAISFCINLPNNILQLAALTGVQVPDISISGLGAAIDKLLSKPAELAKLAPK